MFQQRPAIPALLLSLCLALAWQPARAEYQPAMEKALHALQVAKRALQQASHDKGGHRAEALRHVQKAIRYDNRH